MAHNTSRDRDGQLQILWLTNIPTPYTMPVWRELSAMCRLTVACHGELEANRSWQVDQSGVDLRILHSHRLELSGERTLYWPTPALARLLLRRPDVLVIDGWESPAALQALVLAKLLRIKILLSYWSTSSTHRYATGLVPRYRSWFFSLVDGAVTPGVAATAAAAAAGIPEQCISTGMATVDLSRFTPAHD